MKLTKRELAVKVQRDESVLTTTVPTLLEQVQLFASSSQLHFVI